MGGGGAGVRGSARRTRARCAVGSVSGHGHLLIIRDLRLLLMSAVLITASRVVAVIARSCTGHGVPCQALWPGLAQLGTQLYPTQ